MIVIVIAIGSVHVLLGFDRGLEFILGHFAFRNFGLVEQEIDDLVFVKRGAQLGRGERLVLDVFDKPLAIFLAVLLRSLLEQHVHFLIGNFYAVALADFRKQQTKAHAAFCDRTIIVFLAFDLGLGSRGIGLVGSFLLELRPDLVELGGDHRRRHFEIMARGQLVEQRALHLRPRLPGGFLLKLSAQEALELLEAFEPERLGEFVVDLAFARNFHRMHGDVEGGVLAGEFGRAVIGGERHRNLLGITSLGARELLFETRDEAPCTDLERLTLGTAAIERGSIELAHEIDDQLVAVAGLVALLGVREAFLSGGDLGHSLGHFGVADRDHQLFELEPVERRRLDLRQDFERNVEFGILAFLVPVAQRDIGLHRGTQRLFAHQAVHRLADRSVQRFLVERRAVHLLEQVGGDFARAETGHLHRWRHLGDFAVDPRGNVLGRDRDGVAALQALVDGLDNLHDQ